MRLGGAPPTTEQAILAVLVGVPLHDAAARVPMDPIDLADAVELYRTAGLTALESRADTGLWCQVHIEFADRDTAERVAAPHLGLRMRQAEAAGVVATWWFIRKAPYWRLRCRPGRATALTETAAWIGGILDDMLFCGLIVRWRRTIYEPERWAFGGPAGMRIAHRLFHADSRGIIDYLSGDHISGPSSRRVGRRELSILLCSVFMRGAGQDWYEQGDVWHRVSEHRIVPAGTPLERLPEMKSSLRRLMIVDLRPGGALTESGESLAFALDWVAEFNAAGAALRDAAHDGQLTRGMRNILAHHVIFHWNRMGLSFRTQSILARAAREIIFDE